MVGAVAPEFLNAAVWPLFAMVNNPLLIRLLAGWGLLALDAKSRIWPRLVRTGSAESTLDLGVAASHLILLVPVAGFEPATY
jgi:hypothetical protein